MGDGLRAAAERLGTIELPATGRPWRGGGRPRDGWLGDGRRRPPGRVRRPRPPADRREPRVGAAGLGRRLDPGHRVVAFRWDRGDPVGGPGRGRPGGGARRADVGRSDGRARRCVRGAGQPAAGRPAAGRARGLGRDPPGDPRRGRRRRHRGGARGARGRRRRVRPRHRPLRGRQPGRHEPGEAARPAPRAPDRGGDRRRTPGAGRPALEDAAQRERQDVGDVGRAARARPQLDRRLRGAAGPPAGDPGDRPPRHGEPPRRRRGARGSSRSWRPAGRRPRSSAWRPICRSPRPSPG